jgi:hypothetical protein
MPGVRVGFARRLPARRRVRLAPVLAVPKVIVQCAAMLDPDHDQPENVVRDVVAAYRRAERRMAPPAA